MHWAAISSKCGRRSGQTSSRWSAPDRPADSARVDSLRARFDRDESPARAMLARYEAGDTVAGLRRP